MKKFFKALKDKIKQNIKEISIAIIYFFRQAGQFITKDPSTTLGGNVDPFYTFAPLEIIDSIKNKRITFKYIMFFIPIILFSIIKIIFIKNIIVSRTIINVIKILVCILVLLYVKRNIFKINLYKVCKSTTVFMGIFAIIALILNDSKILWRFNDFINKYTTTRLQFFYLEPSELGFHASIIVIILISCFFSSDTYKEKIKILLYILIDLIVIYLARPFGAIVILTCTVAIILICDLIKKFNKIKFLTYTVLTIVAIAIFIGLYFTESPIMMRLIDTINGTDSSNSYRVNLSIELLKRSLPDYNYLGCGLGNLNSHQFRLNYADMGIAQVLANSFIYYMIEGGIFSIITLLILIAYLIKNTIKEYSILKIGLVVFVIAYQIFGGHFTSGLIWALYGIILSPIKDRDILAKE